MSYKYLSKPMALAIGLSALQATNLWAHGMAQTIAAPEALVAPKSTSSAPLGVMDLSLRELFQMPVGARGLAPSAKLVALDGQHVRVNGFMVTEETPSAGRFILSPVPAQLSDEDEPESDDLPPNVVYVHFSNDIAAKSLHGSIQLTGVLRLGIKAELDGRLSMVRLELDPALVADLPRQAKQ